MKALISAGALALGLCITTGAAAQTAGAAKGQGAASATSAPKRINRAIELHRLEPAFAIAASKMEDAPRVIAAIGEGSHFGKICMEFGRAQ
ncbi:MAG: hypothetical protein J0G94_07705 [Sphingomonadales bacterium]|nr:hypothetical protein [Sphingomonadales bacterium]